MTRRAAFLGATDALGRPQSPDSGARQAGKERALRTIITIVAALPAVSPLHAQDLRDVTCAGAYRHHLQGICVDDEAIDWSFTTTLVSTDVEGQVLLVTDDACRMVDRHEFDCSLGTEGLPEGRLLAAGRRCDGNNTGNGCTGSVQVALPDEKTGLTPLGQGTPK
jgi:hypothetical protein